MTLLCDKIRTLHRNPFDTIKKLEDEREQWLLRSIATIDLSQGIDTYTEFVTLDIDSMNDLIQPVDGYYYFPVAWRERKSFLELDCKLNSGESLQLVRLDLRHLYAEWNLWLRVQDKFPGFDEIPECIEDHVSAIIHGTYATKDVSVKNESKVEEGSSNWTGNGLPEPQCSHGESENHQGKWADLLKVTELRLMLEKIALREPLIFRAPVELLAIEDRVGTAFSRSAISILKFSERKTIRPSELNFRQKLIGMMLGQIDSSGAHFVKIIAPPDVRFVEAACYGNRTGDRVAATTHGDGSWLHSTMGDSNRLDTLSWTIDFRLRRKHLLTPGIFLAALSIVACALWFILTQPDLSSSRGPFSFELLRDVFRPALKDVATNFPFALLFAYYISQLTLFLHMGDRSYLCALLSAPYLKTITFLMGVTISFPFVSYLHALDGWPDSLACVWQIFVLVFQIYSLLFFSIAYRKKNSRLYSMS